MLGILVHVGWDVEFTDEFETWWNGLTEDEQASVDAVIDLLIERGVTLRFPHSSGIHGSRHSHMRELRIQHAGRPYRVLYAMDPRRTSILLLGGDKTGQDRWYDVHVPVADQLYDEHIAQLVEEGLIKE